MHLIGKPGAQAQGRETVVGAIGVDTGTNHGGLTIEYDTKLATIGAENIVDSRIGALKRETKGLTRCAGMPHGGHSVVESPGDVVGGGIQLFPAPAQGGPVQGNHNGVFPVVRHIGRVQCMGGQCACRFNGRHGADDCIQVKHVSSFGIGMDAIAGKEHFPFECCLFFIGFGLGSFEDYGACFFHTGHFQPHVYGRNGVVVGEDLHGTGRLWKFSGLQVVEHLVREGVNETDVGRWIVSPGLADDTLHGTINTFRRGAPIVHGKLDEE